jgi:hypothetical protein
VSSSEGVPGGSSGNTASSAGRAWPTGSSTVEPASSVRAFRRCARCCSSCAPRPALA